MIKITKDNGVKTGLVQNGKEVFQHAFFNFDIVAGREVALDEKQIAYIKRANTQFLKAQKLMSDFYVKEEK